MSEADEITVIVVDDESPARGLVREYLADHPDMRLVAECANGFEAVKAANMHKPDLMILDVQMPKLDGFEVLELLGTEARGVIFTTAYDSYALRAFKCMRWIICSNPLAPSVLPRRWRWRELVYGSPSPCPPASCWKLVATVPRLIAC